MSTYRWRRPANRTTSRWRAVGGRLLVVDDRLVFRPGRLDARLGAEEFSVRLADVASFEIAPVDLRTLTGLRRRLAVVRRDGHRELFLVGRLAETIEQLRRLAAEGAR